MSELEIEKVINNSIEAEKIFRTLQETDSMSVVSDIVNGLSEDIAKLVLKKFVYAGGI